MDFCAFFLLTLALLMRKSETPEPPKSCELRNDTILEVVCIPGKDGGLTQHFLLEIVGGNSVYNYDPSRTTDLDNDIPAMNDQVI